MHELLAVEVWRENVFPRMIRESSRPTSSFPAYLVVSASHPPSCTPPHLRPCSALSLMLFAINALQLYHEGTVASLLETALYCTVSSSFPPPRLLDSHPNFCILPHSHPPPPTFLSPLLFPSPLTHTLPLPLPPPPSLPHNLVLGIM